MRPKGASNLLQLNPIHDRLGPDSVYFVHHIAFTCYSATLLILHAPVKCEEMWHSKTSLYWFLIFSTRIPGVKIRKIFRTSCFVWILYFGPTHGGAKGKMFKIGYPTLLETVIFLSFLISEKQRKSPIFKCRSGLTDVRAQIKHRSKDIKIYHNKGIIYRSID